MYGPTPQDVLIFGAGNIGRGVVAARVAAVGFRPVLVVSHDTLRLDLARTGVYTVHLVGGAEGDSEVRVSDFAVLSTGDTTAIDQAVTACGFAAVSVGGHNLHRVAPLLAPGLARRDGALRILVCENMPGADRALIEHLTEHGVAPGARRTGDSHRFRSMRFDLSRRSDTEIGGCHRFSAVRTSVEPMFRPADQGVDIIGEADLPVFVNRTDWGDDPPVIPGLEFVEDVEPYYARKLFTNNAGHAHIAYLGAWAGYSLVHEAAVDPRIALPLRTMLEAAADALSSRFGLPAPDLAAHIDHLLCVRYVSTRFCDTIARLARDPLRKLAPGERLIGLLRLLESCGMPSDSVCPAIAAALRYRSADDPSAPRMAEMIAEGGPGQVLTEVCGLQPSEPAYVRTLALHAELERGSLPDERGA